jgi:DNA-binding SARP family transcriptional activator
MEAVHSPRESGVSPPLWRGRPPVGGRPRAELSRWAGEVLVTREPGYLLRLRPGALDAARFEELTASGRRALADLSVELAGEPLREALGLWRGRAFEEFLETDFVAAESDRLAELRLVALEDRIEADLRLGRQRELVADLEGLVREHPLRERLWAQLLVALYRSGRQAEALSAYQRARSILVEELGIDPGPAAAGAAWAAADRQIVDEAPAIPLLVPQGIDLVSKRVGNYQHNPPLGAVLSQLWVI